MMTSSTINERSIQKIAILCFPGLGDTILFTPCIKPIRSYFKDAEITVITMFESSAQVLERNPDVDNVIFRKFLDSSTTASIKYIMSLRKHAFDLAILPFPSFRREYNITSYLLGANYRASHKFDLGYWSQLAFLNNITVKVDRHAHNVKNNLNLISALGVPIEDDTTRYKLDIVTDSQDYGKAISILDSIGISRNDFLVGVHPGSFGRAKEKRWSEVNFAALCDELHERYSANILLFVGPEEVDVGGRITSLCKVKIHPIVNQPIRVVYNLLKFCRLVVSDDSGIMHLAAAAGTKVVAIFGPTDDRLLFPWGVDHRIVKYGLECSPCYYYTQVRSKKLPLINCTNIEKFACIKNITLQQVMSAVSNIISDKERDS